MSRVKGRRILIDEEVYSELSTAVLEIKNTQDYSKINESKLGAEILKRFFRKYYSKDKKTLSKKFFNKKAFLRNLIQNSSSDDELIRSFEKHLKKPRKKPMKEKEL